MNTNQFVVLTFRYRDSISIGHSCLLADDSGDSRNKGAHLLQSELPEQPINLIPKPTYRAHILRELILAKQVFVAFGCVTFVFVTFVFVTFVFVTFVFVTFVFVTFGCVTFGCVTFGCVTFDASTIEARTFDVTHLQRFQHRPRRKNSM
jgi:hypothetical protein